MQVIRMLQSEGVIMPGNASDGQVISAYLIAIADSPSFRKKVTAYVYGSGAKSADGDDGCSTSDPANVNNPGCPQYWAPGGPGYVASNDVNTPTTTAPATSGGSGFLSGLGSILGSTQFQTILDTAANQLNTKNTLKEQQNQIQLATINAANNATLANAGITPAGSTATGMSTGAKVAIFIGVIVLIGGILVVMSKRKGAQTVGKTTLLPYTPTKQIKAPK